MNKRIVKYSSNHSSKSNQRKTVGVTIKPELIAKARDMKLNLSKTLEKSLEIIFETQNGRFLNECSFTKENSVEPRAGFEPATSALPRQCPTNQATEAIVNHHIDGFCNSTCLFLFLCFLFQNNKFSCFFRKCLIQIQFLCDGYVCGGRRARSKAQGLGPCPVGVRGFESHPPHHLNMFCFL